MLWLPRRRLHRTFQLLLVSGCVLLLWWIPARTNSFNVVSDVKCATFPGSEDVFVAMKSGTMVLHERLPAHFRSTFQCIPDYIIYSDKEETFHGRTIHDVLSQIDGKVRARMPEFQFYDLLQRQQGNFAGLSMHEGWKLDKWKFLPFLRATLEARPGAKWFVFMEDDTAIVWSNLIRWLSSYDDKQLHCFAHEERVVDHPFPYGGSGVVLSNAALRKTIDWMLPRIDHYYNVTRDQVYGDVSLGLLLEDAGIPLTDASTMFQRESPSMLVYTESMWCKPVITHHHMSADDVTSLWRLEQKVQNGRKVLTPTIQNSSSLTIA